LIELKICDISVEEFLAGKAESYTLGGSGFFCICCCGAGEQENNIPQEMINALFDMNLNDRIHNLGVLIHLFLYATKSLLWKLIYDLLLNLISCITVT
jgi:hypothetical protein